MDELEDERKKQLDNAAQRALHEAAERRKNKYGQKMDCQQEINGRDGPEATRYGDWEKNGIISDF